MEETISATEANRNFSNILRGVREGHSYVVTSHDRPVARIAPINDRTEATSRRREAARVALLERLRNQPAMNIGPWTRDELYDE